MFFMTSCDSGMTLRGTDALRISLKILFSRKQAALALGLPEGPGVLHTGGKGRMSGSLDPHPLLPPFTAQCWRAAAAALPKASTGT